MVWESGRFLHTPANNIGSNFHNIAFIQTSRRGQKAANDWPPLWGCWRELTYRCRCSARTVQPIGFAPERERNSSHGRLGEGSAGAQGRGDGRGPAWVSPGEAERVGCGQVFKS